jgi:O-antigen ligase
MKLELQPGQPLALTMLGQTAQGAVEAQLLSVSGRRMTLAAAATAVPGSAVQIESPSYVILAEVISAHPSSNTLVLHIRQVLQTEAIEYIRQQWT